MKSRFFVVVLLMGCMSLTAMTLAAQQSGAVQGGVPASGPVPNLIKYSGVLKDANGAVLTTLSGVTFLIYKDEQGGTPLWMETQNVQPDKAGRYTVQWGGVTKDGLPADVFMTGEARWLALQIGNEAEQPRVTLVAVPYAMKAADAQTLGGLPASAFVLAAPEVGEVVPEVVSYEANSKDAQGVDYSRLTALLIEAVKQQQTQIAVQQRLIHKLSHKVGVLESSLHGNRAQARSVLVSQAKTGSAAGQ